MPRDRQYLVSWTLRVLAEIPEVKLVYRSIYTFPREFFPFIPRRYTVRFPNRFPIVPIAIDTVCATTDRCLFAKEDYSIRIEIKMACNRSVDAGQAARFPLVSATASPPFRFALRRKYVLCTTL